MGSLRNALASLVKLGFAVALLTADARGQDQAEALKQADAAFHAGYAAMQAGSLEQAKGQFAEVVRLAPQIPEGHAAYGEVLFELGNAADAATQFQQALQLKPGDAGIEANLALAYAKAGDPAKALPQFAAAYGAGGPQVSAELCLAYGRALAATGQRVQAIQMMQQAVTLGAATVDVFDDLGSLYAQGSDWSAAQPQFERALAIDKAYAPAQIHLGIVERQQNNLQAALATLQLAVTADPGNAWAQLEYGRTLAAAGQDEAATPHLEQAAREEAARPNSALAGAQNDLAMALQRQGKQQEAIPFFQEALKRDPHNAGTLTNLGLALTLTGSAKQALGFFQQAMELGPPDATLWKDLGVAHVQLSDFDEAITDFQSALKLDAQDPQLHYDLGMAYKFKDRVDDAVVELSRAADLNPTLPDPPYTLGILYMQTGKMDDAVMQLRKAVTLRPENGDAWAILGSTLKQDARLPEAREALEKAIPLLPGQPGPRVTLAAVLAEQAGAEIQAAEAAETAGDPQKAGQLRAEAKDLRAQAAEYRRQGADLARNAVNRQKADFALNAGNQLLLKGQIADAVSRYQESIAADPGFAEPHVQLALAYERQGRAQDAALERATAARLNSADPGSPKR